MTPTSFKPKILCVDDTASILEVLSDFANRIGFEPILAANAREALKALESFHSEVGIVISDITMPETNGIELRQQVLSLYPELPFIIMSGRITRELALQGLELKISAFVEKPFTYDQLKAIVEGESARRVESIRERHILEATFLQESWAIVEEVEPLILNLEHAPDDMDTVNGIFRLIHTIKGSGGAVGFKALAKYCHAFEESLGLIKSKKAIVDTDLITTFLTGIDTLKTLLKQAEGLEAVTVDIDEAISAIKISYKEVKSTAPDAISQNKPSPAPIVARAGEQGAVRVPTATLDEFMELSGEITVIRNMVNKLVRSIEKSRPGDRDVGFLIDLLDEMHKVNGRMQAKVIDLRKIPMHSVFRPLPRTVRDLSRTLGKDIHLVTHGDDLRVDTAIGHVLSESLIHLMRNAADHGLENAEERVAGGKPPQGSITITTAIEGDEVVVTFQDDGRGINPDRIKTIALERKLVSQEAVNLMTRNEVFELIFQSGFSTAAVVSDVSGRGVGMDMVKTSVSRLGGRIDIRSELGRGTTFNLRLPVPKSVVIINSLLVGSCRETFAVPQDSIVRLLRIEAHEQKRWIASLGGGIVLRSDDGLVPLVNLSDILKLSGPQGDTPPNEEIYIVQMRCEHGEFGLVVDHILDSEDVVVKPAGPHMNVQGVFSGVTFLGDGSVGLILDPDGIGRHSGIKDRPQTQVASGVGDGLAAQAQSSEYLVFTIGIAGLYAIPLREVYRLEEFASQSVKMSGGRSILIYRNAIMPIHAVDDLFGKSTEFLVADSKLTSFVLRSGERFIAFTVAAIVDVVTASSAIDTSLADGAAVAGHVFMGDQAVAVIDVAQLLLLAGITHEVIPVNQPQPSEAAVEIKEIAAEKISPVNDNEGWGLFN